MWNCVQCLTQNCLWFVVEIGMCTCDVIMHSPSVNTYFAWIFWKISDCYHGRSLSLSSCSSTLRSWAVAQEMVVFLLWNKSRWNQQYWVFLKRCLGEPILPTLCIVLSASGCCPTPKNVSTSVLNSWQAVLFIKCCSFPPLQTYLWW